MIDISELEGRELDVAVAEAKGAIVKPDIYSGDLVMASGQDIFDASMKGGYWQWNGEKQSGKVTFCFPLPKWHGDFTAAGELMEDALATIPHCAWALESFNLTNGEVWWDATFWGVVDDDDNILDWNGKSQSLPTAISRAYLKAKESRDGH